MKIDLLSPASFAAGQPHDQFDWLRRNAPVRWHEEPGGRGFWAVTRHADVWAVDRDFQAYSSEPTIMIADPAAEQAAGFGPYKMMLMMDPPEHTAFRKLIRSEFTQPAARLREDRIKALARRIVDGVIDQSSGAWGECDFVSQVAGEMPSFVIAELMGLPLDDGRELYKLTETIHTAPEALPPGAGGAAVMKMFDYGAGGSAEERARAGDGVAC
ncbi:MAG: cytochrome P450, partial [Proteobacteria bacterium]|nr:cytochrome P450 [Pseudomonadota bacterium]